MPEGSGTAKVRVNVKHDLHGMFNVQSAEMMKEVIKVNLGGIMNAVFMNTTIFPSVFFFPLFDNLLLFSPSCSHVTWPATCSSFLGGIYQTHQVTNVVFYSGGDASLLKSLMVLTWGTRYAVEMVPYIDAFDRVVGTFNDFFKWRHKFREKDSR